MRKIILIILFVALFGFVLQPNFVFSENTGGNNEEIEALNKRILEKKNKVKNLEKSIEEYKDKIQKKRTEAVSLSNQISILDNRTIQVELDIESTEEKLDTLTLEIEQMELTIEEKEKSITKQKDIISELIRTIYQEEGKGIIEILAAYDDFSEFYDRLQYLQTIQSDIGQSARSLRIAKEEIEDKKVKTEDRKSAYEELNGVLEEKKKDLEEQTFLKSDILAQTHSSELTYKTLLSNLKNQYKEIENEIVGIEQEVRRRLEVENKLTQTPEDQLGLLSWPSQSRYITSRFHDPDYPYRHIFEHNAIDIRAGQGTPIKAAASGYIARARRCSSSSCYGYVVIVHTGGLSTVYGHLNNIIVLEDQFVTRGDVIGLSGGTPGTVGAGPFVTGPHLHFEVRKNGIPVNPLGYLIKDY